MAYVPLNPTIFNAVYTAALAAMNISSRPWIPKTTVDYYDDLAATAGAFAQQFDTTWALTATDNLDILLASLSVEAMWETIPPPSEDNKRLDPVTYAPTVNALIVQMQVAQAYYAAQGIIPPPSPPSAGVASVLGTAPIASSGGVNPNISIAPATGASDGSMSAANFAKLATITPGAAVALVSGTAPIVSSGGTTPAISIVPATPIVSGSMSAPDKAKLDTVAAGAAVSTVTGTAPIASSGGGAPNITIAPATGANDGSMSAANFAKLATITSGAAVALVSGTAPIVSSGGTTPAISINPATGAVAGSMSAANFTKLAGIQSEAHKAWLSWGNNNITATVTTRYLTPWYSDNTGQTSVIQYRALSSGTLKNLRVRHNGTAGNGNAIVYTLRVNGVVTALFVSLASTATDASNLVDTVAIVSGDLIDIEVTKALAIGSSPTDIVAILELAA